MSHTPRRRPVTSKQSWMNAPGNVGLNKFIAFYLIQLSMEHKRMPRPGLDRSIHVLESIDEATADLIAGSDKISEETLAEIAESIDVRVDDLMSVIRGVRRLVAQAESFADRTEPEDCGDGILWFPPC